jgi:hypothetical protein
MTLTAYPSRHTALAAFGRATIIPEEPGRDVHGLSTHKVYPTAMSPPQCVSSYLTFSPLSAAPDLRPDSFDGYFLWHLLFPHLRNLPVRKYGALRCPDFPLHPLPDVATEQAAAFGCKNSSFEPMCFEFPALKINKSVRRVCAT